MVLEIDVALGRFAEFRKLGELALRNALVPVLRPLYILDVLGAVHVVDTSFRTDNDVHGIPLPRRIGGIDIGRVELVEPTGLLGIVSIDVVLDLHLGSGLPGRVFLLGDVIHEPAVPALGNLVIEFELEGIELLLRDDVAATFFGQGERTILHDPLVADALFLEIAPLRKVLAVEEQLPTVRLFLLGKGVRGGLVVIRHRG